MMCRTPGKRTWTLRVLPGPGDPASDDGAKETHAHASLKALLAAGPFAASPGRTAWPSSPRPRLH